VVHAVIADTKRANLTGFLRLNKSFPGPFAGFSATVGCVDQVEVNIGEVRLREGGCD